MASDPRGEVEELYVAIRGDVGPLLDDAKEGVGQVTNELGKFEKAGKRGFDETTKGAKGLAVQFGVIAGVVTTLTNALLGMAQRGVAAVGRLIGRAGDLQTELQQGRIVFTNMFGGDAAQAETFLTQLRQQAAQLGVSFEDASRFAKAILPDTRSMSEFNELLRLAAVGARDANLPLSELIFSFNEAVSGDYTSIRDRLDIPRDVISKVKEADTVTGGLIEQLNLLFTKRGINDLGAFSDTLTATTNQINNLGEDLLRIASAAGFEELQAQAQALLAVVAERRPDLEKIAAVLGEVAGQLINLLGGKLTDTLKNLDTSQIVEVASSLGRAASSAQTLFDIMAQPPAEGGFLDTLSSVGDALDQAFQTATKIQTIQNAQQARAEARKAKAAELGISPLLAGVNVPQILLPESTRQQLDTAGEQAYYAEIEKGAKALEENQKAAEARAAALQETAKATQADTSALKFNFAAGEEVNKSAEKTKELLADLGADLLDVQADTSKKLEEEAADHNEKMVEISNDYVTERLDLGSKLADELAELEADTNADRAKIVKDAQKELADLAAETDKEITDRQAEFQEEERRETEDHLREMRRLREQYLYDLEGAVASRDARAIVNLQRRFQLEQQQRQEDFGTQQQRQRQDQSQALAEIRANESQKAEEIRLSREQDLQELMLSEQQKRQELQNSYQAQLLELDQKHAEMVGKEQAQYQERLDKLNAAMEERLTKIAEGLAGQLDLEQETANDVLTILAEKFGPDGEAVKILEAYAQRRAELLALTGEELKAAGSPAPSLPLKKVGEGFGGIPSFAEGGAMIARKPTLVQFGERPELAQFTPLSQLSSNNLMTRRTEGAFKVQVDFTGVPAGINQRQMEQVAAAVLVKALSEAGMSK